MSQPTIEEVIAFLLGEGELCGHTNGDGFAPLIAGKFPARYWWRSILREAWNTRPTAQAVAVDDARDARLWRLFIANIDSIPKNALVTGTTEELIAAVEQAALEGR